MPSSNDADANNESSEIDDLPLDSNLNPPSDDTSEPTAESQLLETREQLLRAQAETENVRKRTRREYEDLLRYGEINLLRDILPVLDNIERAIEASEKTADVESLLAGFRMTAQQIEKLLESHGCKTIQTDGVAFDPSVHEAIAQQPAGETAAGSVVGVASRGYLLHDRVVRPAQVIVAAASE